MGWDVRGSGPAKVLSEGFFPDAAVDQGKEQGALEWTSSD